MDQSAMILNAAKRCISDSGYAKVSLRNIANEAGVALSQLHYYFGSKKDLYKAVIMEMINEYIVEFSTGLSLDNKNLSSLIHHIQEMMRNKPELFKMLFDLTSLALWSKSFKKLLMCLMDEVTKLFMGCIPENKVTEQYSKEVVARVLTGAIFGIALQNSLNTENDLEMIEALNLIPELL